MSSLIGQRGLFQNNPNRFSPAQRKGANPGQAPVLKPSHIQQQIPTPAAKLSVQAAPVQTKKLSSAPAISTNLWQQQAGNLLKQYGPSVMRQFGPSLGRKVGLPLAQRLGPPLARKVGMPLVQRVGLPLARKVFLPLAKRVGFALIRRMGFPF